MLYLNRFRCAPRQRSSAVDDDKKPPFPRASIRLWLAVLLSVVALWFLDGLLKPRQRRRNSDRK
jgi:hypothetical protein